jgi:uncharacterized Ntn-hydrolase superfamily protein
LRVDWHDDPVGQLAELWQIWQPQAASYISRALRPSEMAELYATDLVDLRRAGAHAQA